METGLVDANFFILAQLMSEVFVSCLQPHRILAQMSGHTHIQTLNPEKILEFTFTCCVLCSGKIVPGCAQSTCLYPSHNSLGVGSGTVFPCASCTHIQAHTLAVLAWGLHRAYASCSLDLIPMNRQSCLNAY